MPRSESTDLVIIAGEHSGDQHAAEIVKKIKKEYPNINVSAFGGNALLEAGADVILDMTKFSVVGIWEVWKNAFFFMKLLKNVFSWIKSSNPRAVCFVDYPGFNLRLAQMLFDEKLSAKAGGNIKVLYYISPQIWAWKASRKYKIARLVDNMATILPFEKEHFSKTSLDVKFVGHPFVETEFQSNISFNPDGPILLLPGSRVDAVKKIYPVLLQTFQEITKQDNSRMAVVVYPDEKILENLRNILNKKFPNLLNKIVFVPDGEKVEGSAVIMSSGTMSLKCCLAGIPGAIVYKTNPITYAIGRMLVKIKFLGLANILLKKCLWREFLQSRLRPKSVAKYIIQCLNNQKFRQEFQDAAKLLKTILSADKDISATEWLLDAIR